MINAKPTWRSTAHALLYLLPFLLITGVFTLWPLIGTLAMSLYTKYNFYTGKIGALGLDNFTALFADPAFRQALLHTVILVGAVVPLTVSLALLLAVCLQRITFLQRLFQTIFFLPFTTSALAIALVWSWLLQPDNGPLNYLLGLHIDWLNDPRYSLLALISVCVWHGLGLNIILLLAGLTNLNPHYQEAARIDGASTWQRFWHVTLPLLRTTLVLTAVNTTITTFKVFDQVYTLFRGGAGPGSADSTLVYYIYQQFYLQQQYPRAAAAAVFLFVLIAVSSGLLFIFGKRRWAR